MSNKHMGPMLSKMWASTSQKKKKHNPTKSIQSKRITVKIPSNHQLTKIEQLEVILFNAQQTIMLKDPTLTPDEAHTKAEMWIRRKIDAGSIVLQ